MNDQNMIAVSRQDLLDFFDQVPIPSRKHATSIVSVAGEELGLALLIHYFAGKGTRSRVVGDRCTPGTKSGQRLDAWIDAGSVLYQVEVKNWSAHAIGGKVLQINVQPKEAAKYRIEMWKRVWDSKGFTSSSMSKVLLPMKPPRKGHIEPLIAFWTALHPHGVAEPFFRVRVKGAVFPAVNVFSMSNYLRQCSADQLLLQMPITCSRLRWLSKLFRVEREERHV
jgi:hypothetical protein